MSSFIVNLLRDHASAPRLSDAEGAPAVTPEIVERLKALEGAMDSAAKDSGLAGVILREAVESTVGRARTLTAQYRRSLANAPTHVGVEDLPHLPTVSRADLAARPEAFVADDADLEALQITRAHVAGATAVGPSATVSIPTDSFAPAAEAALLLACLRRRGINIELARDLVALVRVDPGRDFGGAPRPHGFDPAPAGPAWPEADAPMSGPAWPDAGPSASPPKVEPDRGAPSPSAASLRAAGDSFRGAVAVSLPALGGAGYLRFDLSSETWRQRLDPVRLLAAFAPAIVAGTAVSLEDLTARAEEALRVPSTPPPRLRAKAVIVSAGVIARALRDRIEKAFSAPVIDWYGVPEVGPIAYGCPAGRGLHVIAPDIVVESDSATSEITLTGGRNPFLPLVRYRPGDRGRIDKGPCSCGDRSPRIIGFERA